MSTRLIKKTEGGSGGGRGHSNMSHWYKTELIKGSARVQRRIEGKRLARRGAEENASDVADGQELRQ